jgi:hypothetical protein
LYSDNYFFSEHKHLNCNKNIKQHKQNLKKQVISGTFNRSIRCCLMVFNATFNNISVFAGSLSVDLNAFLQSLSSTSITNTSLLGTDHLTWRWGLWFFVSFRIFFWTTQELVYLFFLSCKVRNFFPDPPPLQVKWSFPYWIIRRINGQIYLMYIYFFGLSIKVWWKDFTI